MLDPSVFLKDALKNQKFSDGRSGSFFVFSPDKRFILKTIPKHEFEALESLLPEYYRHLEKYPNSLIMRLLASTSITILETTIYVILMENVFTASGLKIGHTYDLKGSWIDRGGDPNSHSKVRKDNDLTEQFHIGPQYATKLLAQLLADTKLLKDHNIMDYSLLVGVHRSEENSISKKSQESEREGSLACVPAVDGYAVYVLGIIDILQSYNMSKSLEHITKIYVRCKDPHGISAVAPDEYWHRFNTKMAEHFQ